MSGKIILSIKELTKEYGSITAVDRVSFHVRENEIVGLLGPNGAGKTTTINMILGVLTPTHGEIYIEDVNLLSNRAQAMQAVNFAAVYAPLPGNLTVEENLKVFALMYGIKNRKEKINNVIKQFDLEKFRKTKCGVLSSGEQTRAALAKAMLNDPRLLLLDEPTASIDPATAKELRLLIKDLVNHTRCGVLWTSHNMYEVEDTCDRILMLAAGKIFLEGDPKTLPFDHGESSLEDLFISVARPRVL